MLEIGFKKRVNACFSRSRKFGLHINRNEYVEQQLRERQEYWESKVGKMTDEIFQNRQTGYSRIGFKYDEQNR